MYLLLCRFEALFLINKCRVPCVCGEREEEERRARHGIISFALLCALCALICLWTFTLTTPNRELSECVLSAYQKDEGGRNSAPRLAGWSLVLTNEKSRQPSKAYHQPCLSTTQQYAQARAAPTTPGPTPSKTSAACRRRRQQAAAAAAVVDKEVGMHAQILSRPSLSPCSLLPPISYTPPFPHTQPSSSPSSPPSSSSSSCCRRSRSWKASDVPCARDCAVPRNLIFTCWLPLYVQMGLLGRKGGRKGKERE